MADLTTPNLTEQQILGQDPEVLGLQYKRQLANLLTGQAFNQPQGQMISGHYVKPSTLQQILPMINAAVGGITSANLDTEQQKIAQRLRQQGVEESQNIMQALKGTPAKMYEQQAGPTPNGGNIAPQIQTPAQPGSREAAYAQALRGVTPVSQGMIPILQKQLMQEPKWEKVEIPDAKGVIQVGVMDMNAPNPLTTFQVGGKKPEMSAYERISLGMRGAELRDQGIPGYGAPSAPSQTINQGSPILTKPNVSLAPNAPDYAQSTLTMPTQSAGKQPVFEMPQPPAGLSPKQNREWLAKAAEPLTGEPAKKVSGAINYQQSLDNYKNLISNFSVADMANPQKRALLSEAYNTVTLTGKEAFNLGVLNGGDERILSGLQPNFNNPSSLLVTQKTAQQIANNQKNYAANVINNEYKVHQKIVPQNLREFVTITEQDAVSTPKAPPVNPAYKAPIVEKGQWGIIKVVPGNTQ
jgi:hypothetical protein